MAATERQWSIREDGCLFINKNLCSVIYHSSLNAIIISSKDQTITVLDATSGIVLQKSDLSGKKCETLHCIYLPEKDRCVFSDTHAVSVRRDLHGILLLDTALQIPVKRPDDLIKLEIPLAETIKLFDALVNVELAGIEHVEDVVKELDRSIEVARKATEGSHKTAKWATVCIQLQHCALKSVCSALMSEIKRTSQQGQGLPVAAAISDRLAHLLPSSAGDSGPGPVDRSLMYSEAARRHTFSKWPHMGYKWALPEPMAQAGFYHQPNSPGDDRAMCFTCNVCLVCWEPTDEPWSEHERHSPQCPYIKGDFTQNVPLSVTYATQPAQLHGETQKIACISTTCNEDFIATSTRDGNIVVWNISHLLQKECTFNLDLSDATVALKTGLQIERAGWTADGDIHGQGSKVERGMIEAQKKCLDSENKEESIQEINLHKNTDDYVEEKNRPSDDLIVSSLCIVDWSCCKNSEHLASLACPQLKAACSADIVQPSLVCGVSLHRTKATCRNDAECCPSSRQASSLDGHQEVVQLMNRVNQGVWNGDLHIIPEPETGTVGEDFVWPESILVPHLLVVSFRTESSSRVQSLANSKEQGSDGSIGGGSGGSVGEGGGGVSKSVVAVGEGSKVLSVSSMVPMKDTPWSILLDNDPWLDPDVQIVGFTPGHSQPAHMKDGQPSGISKPVQILQNGPSDLSGPFHSFPVFGSEGSSPLSPGMHLHPDILSDVWRKENEGEEKSGEVLKCPGSVLQCVQLPEEFCTDTLEIQTIQPTVDRHYIIVVVAPKSDYLCCQETAYVDVGCSSVEPGEMQGTDGVSLFVRQNGLKASAPIDISVGQQRAAEVSASGQRINSKSLSLGGVMVYKIKVVNGYTVLEDSPCMVYTSSQSEHVVREIFVLPPEVAEQIDEDETAAHLGMTSTSVGCPDFHGTSTNGLGAVGQVAMITEGGSLKILNLADGRIIADLSPEDGDKFVSSTYCTGIERLCACTASGKLKFYQVSQQQTTESTETHVQEDKILRLLPSGQDTVDGKKTALEEDGDVSPGKSSQGSSCLAEGPLIPETLLALYSLTQFENLMPRFTATVPPCWSEIQQEQQQRRHPQHLQQQGEATQHTRSWKLTQNGTTWDEHLFEIVLPRPCSIGHVDVKFTLHPLCTTAPNIEVTLLKQNIGNVGRQIHLSSQPKFKEKHPRSSERSSSEKDNVNYVLDPAFLEKNNAEILCGPIKLSSCLDLSGGAGLVSLSSPRLLNCKPRSLLLHIKGFKNETGDNIEATDKTTSSCSEEKSDKVSEVKKKTISCVEYKGIKCLFENVPSSGSGASAVERLSASAPKQKMTDVKGCDWLAEISLTVRKFKRTSVLRERQQRNTMLESTSFHEKLLKAVTCPPAELPGMNTEHFQNLALDILLWIGSVQMNDPSHRSGSRCLVLTLQPFLPDLIKACFINATRTTSHKCARLLALSIEYAKLSEDQDLAPSFSLYLLQALISCLPLLVFCSSAGAMRWFFAILNHVKCMDTSLVARSVMDLLNSVAAQYTQNTSPLHALLKTRYGLYGHPFDIEMFDVELPHNLRQGPLPPSTYAAAAAKGGCTFHGPSTSTGGAPTGSVASGASNGSQNKEEPDLYEMLNIPLEKTGRSQAEYMRHHVLGLLEVEPLPFTCHATSDGTRVERMDAASAATTATTSGPNITAPSVPLPMGPVNFDEPPPSGGLVVSGLGGGTVVSGAAGTSTGSMSSLAVADSLKKALQTYAAINAKQMHPSKLHQLLSWSGGAPKTTPNFLTPSVTPPSEAWQPAVVSSLLKDSEKHQSSPPPPPPPPPPLPQHQEKQLHTPTGTEGQSDVFKLQATFTGLPQPSQQQQAAQKPSPFPQAHTLLQSPPDQVLVIERMHSGARRFVTLDFGKVVVVTDVVIPACGDLASLSIDVWVQGEEVDGQRLVVASDIGTRTLVMNNIMPAPICRYLKITTVGRYGAGTTRSRIPLGAFYGHSYILPWEWREYMESHSFSPIASINSAPSPLSSPPHFSRGSGGTSPVKQLEAASQSSLVQHLGVFLSLQEDLHCLYSLACSRLSTLLLAVCDAQFVSSHVKYYLKRGQRASEEDANILKAYNECLQLQLQLSLAQRAIARLQRALGVKLGGYDEGTSFTNQLQQASTDKLRVVLEGLLDTLLSLTVPSPAVPQPPGALYMALTTSTAEALFRHICLLGSRHTQVKTGLLLSRVCGSQPWWGTFLGNILQEFFHSEYSQVFPQDRVFVLVSALGQKALSGPSAVHIMDSLLAMLTSVLQPLVAARDTTPNTVGSLDLGLVSWILLFLCRNFETALSPAFSEEGDKAGKREKEGASGRWSFIQGSWKSLCASGGKSRSRRLYSRSMQKRILHHKHKLEDIEAAKALIDVAKDKVPQTKASSKESKAFLKEQEALIKKELAQFRSKHFKDMIYMRRNDLEILRRLPKEDTTSNGGTKEVEDPSDLLLVLPRDRCQMVVRGLMALLLSMDFSCHVDLFLVACKVLARICVACRPALRLGEVMSQDQLEWLILLSVHHDASYGPTLWGGPWASHAITCLLQDLLEGEKMYPRHLAASDEDLLRSDAADDEEQLTPSATSLNLDEVTDDDMDTSTDNGVESGVDPISLDKDTTLMMDLLMEEAELEGDSLDALFLAEQPQAKMFPGLHPAFSPFSKSFSFPKKSQPFPVSQQNGQMEFNSSDATIPALVSEDNGQSSEKKSGRLRLLKTRLNNLISTKSGTGSHGLSVAQDARLEFGLQWLPELRLRVMLSVHMESILGAFTFPIPPPPQVPHIISETTSAPSAASTADDMSQPSLPAHSVLASATMLSQCFDHLFAQLLHGRVSLDTVLQLWLTLNQNGTCPTPQEDHASMTFNPTCIPSVPLGPQAVRHLMEAVAAAPVVSVRSWVFVLHTMCLLINQRTDALVAVDEGTAGAAVGQDMAQLDGGLGSMMASVVLTDPNLVPLVIKFLSGTSVNSSASSGLQFYQAGPTATKAFDDFLRRLLCKSVSISGQNLKELLLKIVFQLSTERGAVATCTGPLDAQCKFVETVASLTFDTVDLNNAISVVAAISALVHQHILCQDPVLCSSSHDSSISARSCFSGLFASLLRGGESRSAGGEASRDQLMCSLLRLVNKLLQVVLPGSLPRGGSGAMSSGSMDDGRLSEGMSDASKLNRAFSSPMSTSAAVLAMSDDEKRQQTNSACSGGVRDRGAGSDAGSSERRQVTERYVADIILANPLVMQNLVQALSYCSSNKMALILGSAPAATSSGLSTTNDSFNMGDPLSVGDGIYQILCTLHVRATNSHAMINSLFQYLSANYTQVNPNSLCRLSEPLLKFLLRVLDSAAAIRHFVQLGGIQAVCSSLVRSSQQFVSVGPSIISTIMQNMSSLGATLADEKAKAADSDNVEGLFNFAPLGTIVATSPTASPPDALIQTSAPHRRARTAAWSYHFYPDEPWVELVVTLPFAVLLRQVDIRPHSGALTTCPSFVSLEISHDGRTVIPTSPPLVTCSLAIIKLQLLRPEVVSSVTLRLHRPRDSMTIGLQQICLRGQRAFGEVGEGPSALLPSEDAMSTCSMGWLRLLHHCLMLRPEVAAEVARAATPTCNLLNTCTSLLISPTAALYAAKIESVLLQLGLSSVEIGLAVINNILRNPAHCNSRGGGHIYLGRVSGVANPYTMEILYQLGITQDLGTKKRVQALLHWLADSAQGFICRQSTVRGDRMGTCSTDPTSPTSSPAPEHVHCVAAVLWYSHELPVEYDLHELVSKDLVQFLHMWSSILPVDSVLKKAVNNVLCACCYIHPPYFRLLLRLTGFLGPDGVSSAVTDDSKDSATRQQHQQGVGSGYLTDDSKEAGLQPQASKPPHHCRLDTGTMTDDSKEATLLSHAQQSLRSLPLDCGSLATIAVVSRSPAAVSQLLDSGLPTVLAQGLAEFCNHQIALIAEQNLASDVRRQRQEATDNGPRRVERVSTDQDGGGLTADLVAAILSFFAELCWEPSIKTWLGTAEGNIFWPALLTLLCNTSAQPGPISCISACDRQRVFSAEERALVETTAIQFFTRVIACHSVNQLFFAKVLCEVIRQQGVSRTTGSLLGTVPLSGFTRRMLLQVLLEDERIVTALRVSPELYCHLNTTSSSSKGSNWRMHHPSFGAGRGCCCLVANINSPCSDVLTHFGDPTTATMVASSLLEGRDDSKQAEALAKESTELGIEVMEYINVAGVLAKVKRVKSPSPSKTGLPPRPPTRRGHNTFDTNSASLKFPHCTLHLQHNLMKGKALPGDLTFSQLLQILVQRSLAPGTTTLFFDITVGTRTTVPPPSAHGVLSPAEMGAFGSLVEWGDNLEDIPDELLLGALAFPSALQLFASVGGLALLAEHLPLLYPHIARQGMATDMGGTENNNLPDLGQEWVTVESSDELFDPYMEPVSPAPASSQAARHVAGAMPTIPPHSLIAFGLFLRLPGYAEVLLKERKKAQCLLRLVLGVTDDGDGGHILTSPIASSLPTLPFTVLKSLLDASPLTTDDGVLLRRMVLDIGVLHLVLACLSVLSHHMPRISVSGFQQETQVILAAMQAAASQNGLSQSEEKTQHYWAKGTGFGTGSTTSSWDAEQALLRQRSEEEHVAGLLQVLGSCINPGGVIPKDFCDQEFASDKNTTASGSDDARPSREWPLPEVVCELLSQSCLIPVISSYLRNDSVLDMARHVPLYRALLHLLRGMAVCPSLVPLLLPMPLPPSQFPAEDGSVPADSTPVSVEKLLAKMKGCIDTYASRLKSNKGKGVVSSKGEEEESEGLALLIPDIQETARIVSLATQRLKDAGEHKEGGSHGAKQTGSSAATTEERYVAVMGPMQFDTFELVTEEGRGLKFNISHHFESNVKGSGAFNNPARTRRLAQEAVTLSTSLPLSYNSSVFVRCDEERLDIMKVLITGPSDTPYANGAFEFDVYFPQDYPNSPPYINLETTGNHTVRFNPNLYNDGKVCLSILNTWHGRPEEKWNAQTSSFLQVLVSIQSLILVSEPYFNEPGYERSRGTPSGTASSREYDANIRQATVKWAMLEQIRNPSACFKEVVHYHFWLKRHEILRQCEDWIAEMEQHSSDKRTGRSIAHSTLALKRHYNQLREELSKLKPPPELEADCDGIDPKGKHYSTDAPQVSASNSIPPAVPKPTSATTTTNLAVNSSGLGPYFGPDGLFVSDPFEQEVPDV